MKKNNKITKKEESKNPMVYIDEDLYKIYDLHGNYQSKLYKNENRPELYFSRMVDLFMFAVIHGYVKKKHRKSLTGKRKGLFDWLNLSSKEADEAIIKSIALLEMQKQKKDDAEILMSKSKMIKIVEEYANEGLRDFITSVGGPDYETNMITLLSDAVDEVNKKIKK